jgi:7-keto-8-aminopelargonate synthetase-like enzyme
MNDTYEEAARGLQADCLKRENDALRTALAAVLLTSGGSVAVDRRLITHLQNASQAIAFQTSDSPDGALRFLSAALASERHEAARTSGEWTLFEHEAQDPYDGLRVTDNDMRADQQGQHVHFATAHEADVLERAEVVKLCCALQNWLARTAR